MQLRIEGEGLRHVELSLEDLKTKFKRHSVAAAMQCSGNRRHGMNEVKKIQGLDWDIGGACNLSLWGAIAGACMHNTIEQRVNSFLYDCIPASYKCRGAFQG